MDTSSSSGTTNGIIVSNNSNRSKRHLPEEIVTDVISRLPVKPVFQLQCLSTVFSSIAVDPYFVDAHLKHSSVLRPSIIVNKWNTVSLIRCNTGLQSGITVEEVTLHPNVDFSNSSDKMIEMVGSCNGLVVVIVGGENSGDVNKNEYFLWNPATIRSERLPSPTNVPGTNLVSEAWGFGYCWESREYKIVRIASYCYFIPSDDDDDYIMQPILSADVFSYKTDCSWRSLDFSKINVMCIGHGTTVKGFVYWELDTHIGANRLLSFDLAKEEFSWIFCPVPKYSQIMEFRGSLAMSVKSGVNKNSFDVWVLRNELFDFDGVCRIVDGSCWEKIFTTPEFLPCIEPIRCLDNHYLLLLNDGMEPNEMLDEIEDYSCYLYDLESNEIKQIPDVSPYGRAEVHNFVESIVSL